MAEHVEREKLLTDICDDMCGLKYTGVCENCRVVALIADAPAANVAPVVYGRWGPGRFNLETGNYEAQCIRCRNFSKEYGKPYCPNCGAKMDGGDNDAAD